MLVKIVDKANDGLKDTRSRSVNNLFIFAESEPGVFYLVQAYRD